MRFGPVPLDQAEGKILGHNISGQDGRRAFKKGKPLSAVDVTALSQIGRKVVYVAEVESDDVGENDARVAAKRHPSAGGWRIEGDCRRRQLPRRLDHTHLEGEADSRTQFDADAG